MVNNKLAIKVPTCNRRAFLKHTSDGSQLKTLQVHIGPFVIWLCLPFHPCIHHSFFHLHVPAIHRYLWLPQFVGTACRTLNLGVSSLFLLPG